MNTKQTREDMGELKRKAYFMARTDVDGDHPDGINCLNEVFSEIFMLITQSNEEYLWKFLEFDFYKNNPTGHYIYNRNMDKERVDEFIKLQEVSGGSV